MDRRFQKTYVMIGVCFILLGLTPSLCFSSQHIRDDQKINQHPNQPESARTLSVRTSGRGAEEGGGAAAAAGGAGAAGSTHGGDSSSDGAGGESSGDGADSGDGDSGDGEGEDTPTVAEEAAEVTDLLNSEGKDSTTADEKLRANAGLGEEAIAKAQNEISRLKDLLAGATGAERANLEAQIQNLQTTVDNLTTAVNFTNETLATREQIALQNSGATPTSGPTPGASDTGTETPSTPSTPGETAQNPFPGTSPVTPAVAAAIKAEAAINGPLAAAPTHSDGAVSTPESVSQTSTATTAGPTESIASNASSEVVQNSQSPPIRTNSPSSTPTSTSTSDSFSPIASTTTSTPIATSNNTNSSANTSSPQSVTTTSSTPNTYGSSSVAAVASPSPTYSAPEPITTTSPSVGTQVQFALGGESEAAASALTSASQVTFSPNVESGQIALATTQEPTPEAPVTSSSPSTASTVSTTPNTSNQIPTQTLASNSTLPNAPQTPNISITQTNDGNAFSPDLNVASLESGANTMGSSAVTPSDRNSSNSPGPATETLTSAGPALSESNLPEEKVAISALTLGQQSATTNEISREALLRDIAAATPGAPWEGESYAPPEQLVDGGSAMTVIRGRGFSINLPKGEPSRPEGESNPVVLVRTDEAPTPSPALPSADSGTSGNQFGDFLVEVKEGKKINLSSPEVSKKTKLAPPKKSMGAPAQTKTKIPTRRTPRKWEVSFR